MSKPDHFKEVKMPKSCNDCTLKKTSYKDGLKCACMKHDFTFENASTRYLERFTCDDIVPYEEDDNE